MDEIPGFSDWYSVERVELQKSSLAKFFVQLRNHLQKVGSIPVVQSGKFDGETFISAAYFVPIISDLEEVPEGEVLDLCHLYFREVLKLVGKAYRRFDIYTNPHALFTQRALEILNWSIEDLEEALGFPRGWTQVPDGEGNNDAERLVALSTLAGDEEMEQWLLKYSISV